MLDNATSWISKYSPSYLNQILMDSILKKKFLRMNEKMLLPNLIITGPPGSGKTSGIRCFTKKFFYKNHGKKVLKLNASEERGVDVVREKIKFFCKQKNFSKKKFKKLVLLDEADSMTEVAQEALRRMMELFSEKVRFIFICNFPSKIIEPIQSRCVVFKLKKIKKKNIAKRLAFILNQEKIFFDVPGLETVLLLSRGDIRQILNKSEIVVRNFGELTWRVMKRFYSISDTTYVIGFFCAFLNKNYILSEEILFDIINGGLNRLEIIQKIFEFTKNIENHNLMKMKVLNLLCTFRIKHFEMFEESILTSILVNKLCKINFCLGAPGN